MLNKSEIGIFCCSIILLLFAGCTQKTSDVITLDLGKAIKTGNFEETPLGNLYSVSKIVPLQANDSTFLMYNSVVGVDSDTIVMKNEDTFISFSLNDGSILYSFDRKGRGPQEYSELAIARLDGSSHEIAVANIPGNNVLKYDYSGKMSNSITLAEPGIPGKLSDGNYVLSYYNPAEKGHPYGIYSPDHKLIREASLPNMGIGTRIRQVNMTLPYGGEQYFKFLDADTVYHVTSEADIPFLVFKQGNYKYSEDYRQALDEHPECIDQITYCLTGDNAFVMYYYDNKCYRDIWDLHTEKLVNRAIQEDMESNYGFPLSVNGQTVEAWPEYVDAQGNLYCFLQPRDSKMVYPEFDEMKDNPVLLILSRKK